MTISISTGSGSPLTLEVAFDGNRDGDFSDANEDISAYVKDIEWQIGFAAPYDVIARDTTIRLTLDNSDKRFSPENANSPISGSFTRGRVIRVRTTYQGTTRTMALGWMTPITPTAGKWRRREAGVDTEGYFARAQRAEVFIPVQESKRADQVIETVLSESRIYPPGFTGRWLLGVVAFGELGENTILGAASDYLTAETGKTTFVFAGDNWKSGVSVYGALRDLAGREGPGRVWLDRAGAIQFWNRHHLITATSVSASLNDTMQGLEYAYGDDLINWARVKARPRLVSASGQTLGQTDRAFKVPSSGSLLVAFTYADQSSGARIAGKNASPPASGTDFRANSACDESGTNKLSLISTCLYDEAATRTQIVFGNSDADDVWIASGAKIRGTKITDFGELEIEDWDEDSFVTYGRQLYTYPYELDNIADASALADYLVDSRKDPRGVVREIRIAPRRSNEFVMNALSFTIGTRIAVTETQTGAAKDYFIIGEIHRFRRAGFQYETTWILEPADAHQYWILGTAGFGELGQTTTLGPL